MSRYENRQIANELDATASGAAFFGNALRVAKDFACLTPEDRSVLDRYATGQNSSDDRFRLQDIAIKIRIGI